MINGKTKRVAGIAAVTLAVVLVGVTLSIKLIIDQSELLSQQAQALAVDQAQQSAFSRLQRLVEDTQPQRDQLQSYYLTSQSDSIDFLNFVENIARMRGIELETINPTEIEVKSEKYLSVGYDISGTLSQVEEFISTLEAIPYVSQLKSVELNQLSSTRWGANVMIEVAIESYES